MADKPFLDVADQIIDSLPWNLGITLKQRQAARGVVSALTHQVEQLLSNGWTAADVRAALDEVTAEVATLSPAAAQQTRWRAALKRAKTVRRDADRAAGDRPAARPEQQQVSPSDQQVSPRDRQVSRGDQQVQSA